MTQVVLPNTSVTGTNLWSQVEDNDKALRDVVNGQLGTDNIVTGLLPPTGGLMPYAGSSAPTGWLLCDGSAVSRTTYATLYGVIGTNYGTGDGATTFNLPDLRGRMAVGKGTHSSVDNLGDNELGDRTQTGTAVANRRPAHDHTVSSNGDHGHSASTGTAGSHTHSVGYVLTSAAQGTGSFDVYRTNTSFTSSAGVLSAGDHTHTVSVVNAGAHTHTVGSTGGTTDAPPFVVVSYLIKT